jgi:hypothetical protein
MVPHGYEIHERAELPAKYTPAAMARARSDTTAT